MTTHDSNGRPYAKLSELKAGDTIELDSGFTCHPPGAVTVHTHNGKPFFYCYGTDNIMEMVDCCEHHYLDGQADDGEHLVGVYSAMRPAQPSHAPAAVDDGAVEA